jgi:regulator of replication initiation timing
VLAVVEQIELQSILFVLGTDKVREDLYDAIYASRYLPLTDHKNKPFHDLLLKLYGTNQVIELSSICTKDVLQAKQDRDQINDMKVRDDKIDELTQENRRLQIEIEQLKVTKMEQQAKNTKVSWRPAPAAPTVVVRDTTRARQTLKTGSVQFGSKPGTN